MAKNIKIIPNPSGGNPHILFTNDNNDEIRMDVESDGSLVFSGKTQGNEIVKIDADTLNFNVKGDIDFVDDVSFKSIDTIDSSGDWIGAETDIEGQKGYQGQKGVTQIKGDKGYKGGKIYYNRI